MFIAVLIIFVINPTFSPHQIGKEYSSNPLGDGPKMRATEKKRKRHRNQHNESARNDALERRLSSLETQFTAGIVNKIAQDAQSRPLSSTHMVETLKTMLSIRKQGFPAAAQTPP